MKPWTSFTESSIQASTSHSSIQPRPSFSSEPNAPLYDISDGFSPQQRSNPFFSDMWITGRFRVILLTRLERNPGTGWVRSQLLFPPIIVLLYFLIGLGR